MTEKDDFLDIERLKQELEGVKIDLSGILDDSRKEINYGASDAEPGFNYNKTSNMIYADTRSQTHTQTAGPTTYHQLSQFTQQIQTPMQPASFISQANPINQLLQYQQQTQIRSQRPSITNPQYLPHHPSGQQPHHATHHGSHQPSTAYLHAMPHHGNHQPTPTVVRQSPAVHMQPQSQAAIRSVDQYYATAANLQQMDDASLSRMLLPKDVAELYLTKKDIGAAVQQLSAACKDRVLIAYVDPD